MPVCRSGRRANPPQIVQLRGELAELKALEAPRRLRAVAEYAWSNRWWEIIGVGVQRSIAESLLRHGGVDLIPQQGTQRSADLADVLDESGA